MFRPPPFGLFRIANVAMQFLEFRVDVAGEVADHARVRE
jgi:hypothetical protein